MTICKVQMGLKFVQTAQNTIKASSEGVFTGQTPNMFVSDVIKFLGHSHNLS